MSLITLIAIISLSSSLSAMVWEAGQLKALLHLSNEKLDTLRTQSPFLKEIPHNQSYVDVLPSSYLDLDGPELSKEQKLWRELFTTSDAMFKLYQLVKQDLLENGYPPRIDLLESLINFFTRLNALQTCWRNNLNKYWLVHPDSPRIKEYTLKMHQMTIIIDEEKTEIF